MPRTYTPISLTFDQKRRLVEVESSRTTSQHLARKARAILWLSERVEINDIAEMAQVSRVSISKWRSAYERGGVEALLTIQPGRGRKPTITADKITEIVAQTAQTKPEDATHWTTRSMAEAAGVSKSTIHRIWNGHDLQPHRVKTFKISKDPRFTEKMTDVVGLYIDPPEKAIVLCVDEKSQIQALDRTQPGLPMKRGRCGTMTHDYKRNGTTTLFAALNVLDGTVFGQCMQRHRHQEFLKFLRALDNEHDKSVDLHLIVDNYGTHNHENVRKWLSKHPRFHLHFTPTSSSWLNLVERWFAELTRKQVRRGVFKSVPDLTETIYRFIELNNAKPKPMVWTATSKSILRRIKECKLNSGAEH